MWAESYNYLEMVKLHLPFEAGYKDSIGMTALMRCASAGREGYKILAEYESDIVD